MFDIDHFKSINDNHGHLIGDQVICHITAILKESLRKSDLLGRFGGEEFAVILPRTRPESAFLVAEKVRKRVEGAPAKIGDGLLVNVTVSGGVSGLEMVADGIELDDLLQRADHALYEAKRGGRNRVAAADVPYRCDTRPEAASEDAPDPSPTQE